MSFSIRPQLTPIGPVHVRMSGVVRGDQKGPGIAIVNAPTAAEATAELHRVARVAGADKVVSVAADYRRAALAGGTASTQWRIEVQAWGTAMGPPRPEPSEEPEAPSRDDAEKARADESAKKARDTEAKGQEEAKAEAAPEPRQPSPPPAPVAASPAPAPAPAPAPEASSVPRAEASPAPPPPGDR